MENKFKVGDIVYDEVNFPNTKGIVKNIINGLAYPIEVEWGNIRANVYTIDGRILLSRIPTLSHTPYKIEFKGFSQESPKVLTDEMKVCIKGDGSQDYGKKIIEYLESLGGINKHILQGHLENYYFLDDNLIIKISKNIPEGYKEILLKEDESHICKYCKAETTQPDNECYMANINYVGKKIIYRNAICLIIQQDKESVDICFDGEQQTILLSDIINGKYKIIN